MSPTVLVIDDEPPIRKLLRMGLSTQGYAILEAPNGATALDVLGREGVALSDLRPVGVGSFEGRRLDIIAEGEFIAGNTRIRIIEARGSRIVVRSV